MGQVEFFVCKSTFKQFGTVIELRVKQTSGVAFNLQTRRIPAGKSEYWVVPRGYADQWPVPQRH